MNVTFLSVVDVNVRAVTEALVPRVVRAVGTREALMDALPETDVLIVQNQGFHPRFIDRDVLGRAGRLRLIQHHGVACETTDVRAAAARGIPVATIPGQNSRSVAEHAFFLVMALARRLRESMALVEAGRMGEVQCMELAGKTLCLVGLGSIGRAVARMAKGFDMEVLAVRRSGAAAPDAVDEVLPLGDLEIALGRANAVVLALPLNGETRHLMGARTFRAMRPGALLVNVSRGDHVDRAALEAALEEGRIGGYGTDAWWAEPADPADPLLCDPRVLATPHTGGKSVEAMRRSAEAVRANIERLERGQELAGIVDPATLPG